MNGLIAHRTNETCSTLKGISSCYQFQAVGEGKVLMHRYGCNCVACSNATFDEDHFKLSQDNRNEYSVIACECPGFMWTLGSINVTTVSGVAADRLAKRKAGRDLALKLKIGDWVIAESRNDTVDTFWLGRAVE